MDLMQNLDPRRFEPVLVAPGEGPLSDWARQNRVTLEISAAGDWLGLPALARRVAEFVRIIRRHRISLVHAVAPMSYRALGVAARLTAVPRVCHLGFPPEEGELERSFISGPEVVIGCYEAQAVENRERILRIRPTCRIVGVPNGIDTARFAPRAPSLASSAIREGFPSVVAILGHISDVKGHPTFAEAAAQVVARGHDCLFVAIGGESAQPGARAALEMRVRARGLENRFRFLGFRDDVHEVLNAVDIVATPSRSEGLPLALLEAMATGLPVIATPVGGVPEAVTDGMTGLMVNPDDPSALAAAMIRLLDDATLRDRLGSAARRTIEQRFSADTSAAAVASLYEDLLAARPPRIKESRAALA
jgi:glycosyltransferase involved in cell wall biosynthesis